MKDKKAEEEEKEARLAELAEKEATLETKLANRTVVKHPGVEKPADFKPYVPPAPKEKNGWDHPFLSFLVVVRPRAW